MTPSPAPYRHRAFGLRIGSTISLAPYFAIDETPEGAPDLAIDWGVDGSPRSEDSLDAEWPDLIRVHVQAGRRIWVDALGGLPEGGVAELICGPIVAIALAQRGLVVLHATAVELDGVALAVCGPSGSGKSTTAALLAARGASLMSDDIVPLVDRDDGIRAVAGPTLAKLAVVPPPALGCLEDAGPVAMGDKRLGRWRRMAEPGKEVPLAALAVLEDGPAVLVEPLRGQQALSALLEVSFCLPVVGLRRQGEHLRAAARLAGRIDVLRVARPRTLPAAVEAIDALLQRTSRAGGPPAP